MRKSVWKPLLYPLPRSLFANSQRALNVLGTEDTGSMEVEIRGEQVQKLRERVGDVIAGQLLQKPNEALIAELLTTQET